VSAKIDDGSPAFPILRSDQAGMSLRDWFAGQALAGLCASQWGGLQRVETFVERSLEMADAMLKARKGGSND